MFFFSNQSLKPTQLSNLTRFLTPQKVLPHIHNKKSRNKSPHVTVWLVVSNMFFHFIYGMSSFPLTFIFIFQDGGSTTKQQYIAWWSQKKSLPGFPGLPLDRPYGWDRLTIPKSHRRCLLITRPGIYIQKAIEVMTIESSWVFPLMAWWIFLHSFCKRLPEGTPDLRSDWNAWGENCIIGVLDAWCFLSRVSAATYELWSSKWLVEPTKTGVSIFENPRLSKFIIEWSSYLGKPWFGRLPGYINQVDYISLIIFGWWLHLVKPL